MVDTLNLRIHDERIAPDAATVTVARGQKVAVGHVIISRRNDPSIDIRRGPRSDEQPASVRNGNRWRVAIIDTETNLIGAERLDDNARAVFDQKYFREHISLGYAVTVHSAQGVTADASVAVLREDASRSLLYVAMTRGRHANVALIYERSTEAGEFSHAEPAETHVAQRGDSHDAANFVHRILANDELTITAHDYAAQTAGGVLLPERVRDLLNMRATAMERRRESYQTWKAESQEQALRMAESQERHISRMHDRRMDYGLEL